MKKIILLVIFVCLTGVCQGAEDTPKKAENRTAKGPTPETLKTLFVDAIIPNRVELPSEAIPYWRDAAGDKPATLLLFSSSPFLSPLAEVQQQDVAQLIATGSAKDFVSRGSLLRVNPAFTSSQTVSAALENKLFSKIVWVFPSKTALDKFNLKAFKQQLVEARFFSEAESQTLTLKDGVISGSVRGVPFQAVHSMALQPLDSPVIMHLDLNYFQGLYQNEIKTPIYPLLYQTAQQLKQLGIRTTAATFSYSTLEGELSLETRFLINRFAELAEAPRLLNEKMPPSWKTHADALYRINFFLESKVDQLYEQAIHEAPSDPAVLYGLALRRMRNKDVPAVLALVERAVSQDPGYALEYLKLADKAVDGNALESAAMLLEKGSQVFPQNPFIQIQLASIYQSLNRTEDARELLTELKRLPWSSMQSDTLLQIDAILSEVEKPSLQDGE